MLDVLTSIGTIAGGVGGLVAVFFLIETFDTQKEQLENIKNNQSEEFFSKNSICFAHEVDSYILLFHFKKMEGVAYEGLEAIEIATIDLCEENFKYSDDLRTLQEWAMRRCNKSGLNKCLTLVSLMTSLIVEIEWSEASLYKTLFKVKYGKTILSLFNFLDRDFEKLTEVKDKYLAEDECAFLFQNDLLNLKRLYLELIC